MAYTNTYIYCLLPSDPKEKHNRRRRGPYKEADQVRGPGKHQEEFTGPLSGLTMNRSVTYNSQKSLLRQLAILSSISHRSGSRSETVMNSRTPTPFLTGTYAIPSRTARNLVMRSEGQTTCYLTPCASLQPSPMSAQELSRVYRSPALPRKCAINKSACTVSIVGESNTERSVMAARA